MVKYLSSFVCLYRNNFLTLLTKNQEVVKQVRVILSDEAKVFLRAQPMKAQKKIAYNIRKLESGIKDKELFEKLSGSDIWELRTLFDGTCYRLFSFWDTDQETLVVATHGLVKKTQKTPVKEIARAEAIRIAYFKNKQR